MIADPLPLRFVSQNLLVGFVGIQRPYTVSQYLLGEEGVRVVPAEDICPC